MLDTLVLTLSTYPPSLCHTFTSLNKPILALGSIIRRTVNELFSLWCLTAWWYKENKGLARIFQLTRRKNPIILDMLFLSFLAGWLLAGVESLRARHGFSCYRNLKPLPVLCDAEMSAGDVKGQWRVTEVATWDRRWWRGVWEGKVEECEGWRGVKWERWWMGVEGGVWVFWSKCVLGVGFMKSGRGVGKWK